MKHFISKFSCFCLVAGLATGMVSCDKNEVEPEPQDGKWLTVVVGIDVEGSGATYAQSRTDLSSGETVSFKSYGYEIPSVRTARVYGSNDGQYLYNLSYGGGTIHKYTIGGGETYTEVGKLDISYAMQTTNPRWTKVNEEYALLHNVTTAHVYDNETYSYTNTVGILTAIDLDKFAMVTDYHESGGSVFDFPRSEEDINNNLHVWRIDAPAVYNGKAYYGLNKRSYDPTTNSNVSTSDYKASSLVVDFPSLKNPKIITSEVGKGSTQGYRTPVAHADEKGDIYQICAAPSYMLKISNGDYDNSYVFSLSEAIGYEVGTNGWFYVGNGIGYVPFYSVSLGSGSDAAAWGVARVDLYNKTAVVMNLPNNLWLYQYQMGVKGTDGKFYMALTPMGGKGNIYIFDPTSTSPTGYEIGVELETIDSSSAYLGVF